MISNNSYAQIPEFNDQDNNSYVGLYWGAAGIINLLLKIASENYITQDQLKDIDNMINDAVDAILKNRYKLDNGTQISAWSKYVNGDIYPGQKYGAAGIVKTYINLYHYYNDLKYVNLAKSAIDELYLEISVNSTYSNWPYSYFRPRDTIGIPITDLKYGNLGIIDATLDLYEATNENKYLDLALSSAQWLENVSIIRNIDNDKYQILPWYDIEDQGSVYLTSQGQGNAGAIVILNRLGNLAGDQKWNNWALNIANWLVKIQKDNGAWTNNADRPDLNADTTLDLGVAGVIKALINENKIKSSDLFISSINKGLKWLKSNLIKNDTIFIFPTTEGEKFGKTSLLEGLAGILQVFRISGNPDYYDIVSEGYNWLINNALYYYEKLNYQLIGLAPSTIEGSYIDLSYADGLAGVIDELIELNKVNATFFNNIKLEDIITRTINQLKISQNDNGLWPRQINVDPKFIPGFIPKSTKKGAESINFVLFIFSLLLIVRKNKLLKNQL